MKPSIFIGSSSEQIDVAEAIEANLDPVAEVTLWKFEFNPGRPFISDLSDIKDKYDFAILVITPDDVVSSRGKEFLATRDNIIFEIGLFIGSIGSERVYCVCDQNSKPKIFSDYSGVTFLTYDSNRQDKDFRKALNPTCTNIKKKIKELGSRNQVSSNSFLINTHEKDLIGLEKIYKTYDEAEADILNEFDKTVGPVRLFFQIASRNVSGKGSLFDKLDELTNKRHVEVRILHASQHSNLFSRERLESIKKDYDTVINTLKCVNISLKTLESKQGTSLLRRTHHFPYLWRIYAFENRLYLMPYFAIKDANSCSPVLVFEKTEQSMYHTFVSWFDHLWNELAPKNIRDCL
jgi:hypothetical protein